MGKWTHRSTILDLGSTWKWVVTSRLGNFTAGERAPVRIGEAGQAPKPARMTLRGKNVPHGGIRTPVPLLYSPYPVDIAVLAFSNSRFSP
jgi:hypothetical protein